MKKKILNFMLAFVLLLPVVFAMTACGGGHIKAGDIYKLSEAGVEIVYNEGKSKSDLGGGNETVGDRVEEMLKANFNYTVEFKKDGKATMTIGEETDEATWKEKDDKVTITLTHEGIAATYVLTFSDNKLLLEMDLGDLEESYAGIGTVKATYVLQ